MNLHYDIAWIEDQPDNVTNASRDISNGITQLGFLPQVKFFSTSEEIESLIGDHQQSSAYDLFLVDWNLMDSKQGDEVLAKLRTDGLFTDVVFYSSRGIEELRKAVHDKELEGIFLAERTALADRSLGVIRSTVKKVIDIENMRGIAAACVADIDHLVSSAILNLHGGLDAAGKVGLAKDLNDDLNMQRTKQSADLAGSLLKLSVSEILTDSMCCGSGDLVRNLRVLHDRYSASEDVKARIAKLKPDLEHLLQLRNKLAHVRLSPGAEVKITQGNTETKYALDEAGFTAVRVKFVKTMDSLRRLTP